MDTADFLAPRRCMREPIPEIFEAATILDRFAAAHLSGDSEAARTLLAAADIPAVRRWAEPLLGSGKAYPDRASYVRFRQVEGAPATLAKADRIPVRMPSAAQKAALIARNGHVCAFCGIPLIRAEVRSALSRRYPDTVRWGATFADCHAAFLCMWLQYDHILPHSRGGDNDLNNVAITCAPCNYGRMSHTLAEVGLLDPRARTQAERGWEGLERVLDS